MERGGWGSMEAATECRHFELSVAADIAKLDFMNIMPFRLNIIHSSC
jgi:hypothetical protein